MGFNETSQRAFEASTFKISQEASVIEYNATILAEYPWNTCNK